MRNVQLILYFFHTNKNAKTSCMVNSVCISQRGNIIKNVVARNFSSWYIVQSNDLLRIKGKVFCGLESPRESTTAVCGVNLNVSVNVRSD